MWNDPSDSVLQDTAQVNKLKFFKTFWTTDYKKFQRSLNKSEMIQAILKISKIKVHNLTVIP